MDYNLKEFKREESTDLIPIKKAASMDIKSIEKTIIEAQKKVFAYKKVIEERKTLIQESKDVKIIGKCKAEIEERMRQIRDTEKLIKAKEALVQKKHYEEEVKQVSSPSKEEKKLRELIKSTDHKQSAEKIETSKEALILQKEATIEKHQVSRETKDKIEKFELYYKQKLEHEKNLIKKAERVIIESQRKLESSDPHQQRQAKLLIETKALEIKKCQASLIKIEKEVLEKWSRGKVISFSQDLVKSKAQLIEKNAEIITEQTKFLKDNSKLLNNIGDKKILEEYQMRIEGAKKAISDAEKLIKDTKKEIKGIVQKVDERFGSDSSKKITASIEEHSKAQLVIDECNKKITEISSIIETKTAEIEKSTEQIKFLSLELQRVSSEERRKELLKQIEHEKDCLRDSKKELTFEQEKLLKEKFSKWSNMSNIRVIQKEASDTIIAKVSFLENEKIYIKDCEKKIEEASRKLIETTKRNEVEFLKKEILDNMKSIKDSTRQVEKTERMIIDSAVILIKRSNVIEGIREADQIILRQEELIKGNKNILKNAEHIIQQQKEFLKQTDDKKRRKEALKIISKEMILIKDSTKKIIRYGKLKEIVNQAKIDKIEELSKKQLIKDSERIDTEVKALIQKQQAESKMIRAKFEEVKAKLEKVTDPMEIKRFKKELLIAEKKASLITKKVIKEKRALLKIRLIKIKIMNPKERIISSKEIIKRISSELSLVKKTIITIKKKIEITRIKMAGCKTKACRYAMHIMIQYEEIRKRRLSKIVIEFIEEIRTIKILLEKTTKDQLLIEEMQFRDEIEKIREEKLPQINRKNLYDEVYLKEYFETIIHRYEELIKAYEERIEIAKKKIVECNDSITCSSNYIILIKRWTTFITLYKEKIHTVTSLRSRTLTIKKSITKVKKIRIHTKRMITCSTSKLRTTLKTLRRERTKIIRRTQRLLKKNTSYKKTGRWTRRTTRMYRHLIHHEKHEITVDIQRIYTVFKVCKKMKKMKKINGSEFVNKVLKNKSTAKICKVSRLQNAISSIETQRKQLLSEVRQMIRKSYFMNGAGSGKYIRRLESVERRIRNRMRLDKRRVSRVISLCKALRINSVIRSSKNI